MDKNEHHAPLVSVAMITYKHEKYIREAIAGVLMQEVDFELIIADDCSPDNTWMIVDEIIGRDGSGSRIRYVRHSTNKGVMGNLLWTLRRCTGKYIALCEGDDYWISKDKLRKQVEFMEQNSEFVACGHNSYVVYEDQPGLVHLRWPDYVRKTTDVMDLRDHITQGYIPYHTSSYLFRNLDIDYPKFMENALSGDVGLFTLIAERGLVKLLDDVMSVRRKNAGGVTVAMDRVVRLEALITLYEELNAYFHFAYRTDYEKLLFTKKRELAAMLVRRRYPYVFRAIDGIKGLRSTLGKLKRRVVRPSRKM